MSQRTRRRRRFAAMARVHAPLVRRWAEVLSKGDRDLRDDLEQEGLVALWSLDESRCRDVVDALRYAESCTIRAQLRFLRWHARGTRRTVAVNVRIPGSH